MKKIDIAHKYVDNGFLMDYNNSLRYGHNMLWTPVFSLFLILVIGNTFLVPFPLSLVMYAIYECIYFPMLYSKNQKIKFDPRMADVK